jgi:alkylation response protein AidB-like acyl-CoA dehydrogenase
VTQDTGTSVAVERARRFADDVVRPAAATIDAEGRMPREVMEAMAAEGLICPSLPKQLGGHGLNPVDAGLVTEAIGRACCSTRTIMTIQDALVGQTLMRWGSETHQRHLPDIAAGRRLAAFALTEPEVGSDARGITTRYEADGAGFRLSGRKKWITFGGIADLFLVVATGDDGPSVFLMERDAGGLVTEPMEGLIGNRGTHVAEIRLDATPVVAGSVVGRLGGAFPFVAGSALDNGRYSVAWGGVGIIAEATDLMCRRALERHQFGAPIADHQLIRGLIGDAKTSLHASRALCLRAGELRAAKNPQAVVETTMAKVFASRAANRAAADAVQVFGGDGCSSRFPVERLLREAKIVEIIEGTTQILTSEIAKNALREAAPRPRPGKR